jgi:hypothetical protein
LKRNFTTEERRGREGKKMLFDFSKWRVPRFEKSNNTSPEEYWERQGTPSVLCAIKSVLVFSSSRDGVAVFLCGVPAA